MFGLAAALAALLSGFPLSVRDMAHADDAAGFVEGAFENTPVQQPARTIRVIVESPYDR